MAHNGAASSRSFAIVAKDAVVHGRLEMRRNWRRTLDDVM
jgi:hypothetical protein